MTARRPWLDVAWSPHVRTQDVGGRAVRYADYGSGPALVLVHGLGGAWTTWLENLPALGEQHRVIAVDLPGFGGSDPLPPGWDVEASAQAIAGLLDALGVTDAAVAGHSLGGLVVLRLAVARPDLVARLALVNAGGVPLSRLRLAAITSGFRVLYAVLRRPGLLASVARRPRLRRLALAGAVAHPATIGPELALETIPLMAAPGFLDAIGAGARAVGEVQPELVGCPTLLLWGREDRVLPLAGARELLHRLPDARLVVLDDAAHCPMFEVPDAFDAALLGFTAPGPAPRRAPRAQLRGAAARSSSASTPRTARSGRRSRSGRSRRRGHA